MSNIPHKLGRLYFRYISGTPAERKGWNAEALAQALERLGYIKIVELQGYDALGRWLPKVRRYIELKKLTSQVIEQAMRSHSVYAPPNLVPCTANLEEEEK